MTVLKVMYILPQQSQNNNKHMTTPLIMTNLGSSGTSIQDSGGGSSGASIQGSSGASMQDSSGASIQGSSGTQVA